MHPNKILAAWERRWGSLPPELRSRFLEVTTGYPRAPAPALFGEAPSWEQAVTMLEPALRDYM